MAHSTCICVSVHRDIIPIAAIMFAKQILEKKNLLLVRAKEKLRVVV